MTDDSVVYDHEERTVQRQNERITAEFLALLRREHAIRAAAVAAEAKSGEEKAVSRKGAMEWAPPLCSR